MLEVAFIFSASANGTRFTTNSGTCSMLRTVSFFAPSRVFTGTNISVGGLAVTPWKKENGARLVFPSAEIVETQAIGRGRMVEIIQAYASRGRREVKSSNMVRGDQHRTLRGP